MALVTLKNNTTGHTITVDETSPIYTEYVNNRGYYVLSTSGSTSPPPPSGGTTSGGSGSPTDQVPIYGPGGATQTILRADLSYWQGQGWSTSAPSSPPPTQPPAAGQVTIYGPGGATQTILSSDLSYWQGQGWSTTAPSGSTSGDGLVTDFSNLPTSITESDYWNSLTPDQKSVVATVYNGMVSGSEAAAADAAAALEKAKELADPYFSGLIGLAQDELSRVQASLTGDYESQRSSLERRIQEINDDLRFNRDKLSLDQQAELASLQRNYTMQLEDLQTGMQEAGLVFSSPRQLAEERLGSQFSETAESTRRRFGAAIREQELAAQRGLTDITQSQADLERKYQEQQTAAARAAEEQLGTANLPSGTQQLGTPVTGSIEQQRQQSILNLEQTLRERGSAPLPL